MGDEKQFSYFPEKKGSTEQVLKEEDKGEKRMLDCACNMQ